MLKRIKEALDRMFTRNVFVQVPLQVPRPWDRPADIVIDHAAPIEGAIDITDDGLHQLCWKNVKSLDPIKVSAATMMLYDKFVESGVLKDLIERITENRTGWLHGRYGELGGLHFGFGMQVRNTLRQEGFGEAYFGIDNLDDFYMPLVELACGFQAPGCKACADCL